MYRPSLSQDQRTRLHRRGLFLEYFTVSWNLIEAIVAITAGIIASSTALIAFGIDSLIELISGAALLWRLLKAGPNASAEQHSSAERRALYLVAATFFLLAGYILFESISSLIHREAPLTSLVGLILSIASLIIMPVLAYTKQLTGKKMGSRALVADAAETWVCAFLSLALLLGVGLNYVYGWWWADSVAAMAMLPVIIWQGWETLEEA
ncbi:MAG: cation transporter, partial [bacterium]|nr:cation transporter [bacterium]